MEKPGTTNDESEDINRDLTEEDNSQHVTATTKSMLEVHSKVSATVFDWNILHPEKMSVSS